MSKAAQNAAWARYIIQELVHDFRSNGRIFDDRTIDKAAEQILKGMNPADAAKIRKDFAATGKGSDEGSLAHYLINQYCQYTQQEVNNGQPK